MSEKLRSVVLGREFDDGLRRALTRVLDRNGASEIDKSWGVGGSQEVETLKVRLGDKVVVIEAETYIGLTISGPGTLVERLALQVRQELEARRPIVVPAATG